MDFNSTEAKVTIAKLFELAYSKNKGLTTRIIATKGSAKLVVDQEGKVTLSGSGGLLTFSGEPVLKTLGVKIKRVSISFNNMDGMNVGYSGSFNVGVASLSVKGQFDLEQLILSCTGLLCRAARMMKGRHHAYDLELQRVMGR